MKKLLMSIALSTSLVSLMPQSSFAATAYYTTDQAIQRYQQNYEAYKNDDLVKVAQYRENYKAIKGSLADKVVERAIWYMENGYTVYGHGLYPTEGMIDCSGFTKLVYGDFNYKITGASREYGSVGTAVKGVYPVKENGLWKLVGTENLRPGDILTWWQAASDGTKFISHVAIYMGQLNGQPAVIGTTSNDPTAIGIVNNFKYWYGENFFSAQRVLPEGAWSPDKTFTDHQEKAPVIPAKYILPPQNPITMPVIPTTSTSTTTTTTTQPVQTAYSGPVVLTNSGWVGVFSKPDIGSASLGKLQLGEAAPLIRKYNSWWYEIKFNGQVGYITTSTQYTHVVNQ